MIKAPIVPASLMPCLLWAGHRRWQQYACKGQWTTTTETNENLLDIVKSVERILVSV